MENAKTDAPVSKVKTKKALKSSKYLYNIGDEYPDSSFRHAPCVGFAKEYRGVPPDMGWMWNLVQRKGWRPGALGKSIKKWMKLRVHSTATLQLTKKKKPSKKGSKKVIGKSSESDVGDSVASEYEESVVESPTKKSALKVNKVKDCIYITVHPLKELLELANGDDPFVDCEPFQFKLIQPPSAKTVAHRLAKEKRKYEEDVRKALEYALQDICHCAYEDLFCTDMNAIDDVILKSAPALSAPPPCSCTDELSDTDDSDWDVEYTPPFAMTGMKPKPPAMVHVETQYSETDLIQPASGKNKSLKWKRSSDMDQKKSFF